MAQITLSTLAAALAANAANVATQASLTTANITAAAHLLSIMATRNGEAVPLLKLLTDTDKAQLRNS